MGQNGDVPDRVGRYEIVLPIAKGGMATVYLARAEGLGGFDRYMALKLTASHLRNDPQFAAHLIEEAKLVAHIRHLNVVPVLDVGEDPRGVFLVMEYVPGDSLSGLIRAAREAGTPLPARIGLRVLVDALQGLHAAHEHADEDGHPLHLVHRDFSPQNILVGTDGIARLTDFGIAKAASRVSNTAQGHIKGKISYVSPEQARALPIDRRCDLWAAGVIAWEILADRKLHAAGSRALLEIVAKAPPRIKELVPDVPDALDTAIADVLKVDPDERTPTALLLSRALANAARGASMLADTEEVAELVQKLTARTLADRKARIAEARRQRRGSDPAILATTFGVPALPVGKPRGQLPSLPEVPIARLPDPPTLTSPTANDIEEEVDIDLRESESPSTPLSLTSEARRPPPLRASASRGLDRQKAIIVASACAGLGVLLVILAIAFSGPSAPSPPATASAAASIAPPSTAVVAPLTATPVETNETPTLEVSANAPITRVKIGARVIDIDIPAPHVTVDLEPEDLGKDLVIGVTSNDGRYATVPKKQDEEPSVKVTFGAKPPPPPAPAPAPAPKPRPRR